MHTDVRGLYLTTPLMADNLLRLSKCKGADQRDALASSLVWFTHTNENFTYHRVSLHPKVVPS